MDRDGSVLAGTNRGVARLAGGRAVPVNFGPVVGGDTVHAIFRDAAGVLCLGLERRGLARIAGRGVEIYGQREGFPRTTSWSSSRTGRGTSGSAIVRRRTHVPAPHAFSGFGVREGLRTDDVQSIFQSRDGADLDRHEQRRALPPGGTGNWTRGVAAEGLADDSVFSLTEDRFRRHLDRHAAGRELHPPQPRDRSCHGPSCPSAGAAPAAWAQRHAVDRDIDAGLWTLKADASSAFARRVRAISPTIYTILADQGGRIVGGRRPRA